MKIIARTMLLCVAALGPVSCGTDTRADGGDDSDVLDVGRDEAAPPEDADLPRDVPPDEDLSEQDADSPCEGIAHCANETKDCDETGVDCGGGCPACGRLATRGNWLGMVGQDGLWRAAIPCGMVYGFQWYNESNFDRVAAAGKNLIYAWAGAGFYGVSSASLFTDGDFSQGFDAAQWTALEQMLQDAAARDIGVLLALWDTTGLEGDRSVDDCPDGPRCCWDGTHWTCRWDVNPWNAAVGRGGPYDLPGCGKAAFVEIPSPGVFIYDPGDSYPSAESDAVKGQWRQEQIVYHLAELVRGYPNVAFYMMWEAHDAGSHLWGDCATTSAAMQAWHEHMAGLVHSISPDTMITTGEIGRGSPLYPGYAFASCQAQDLSWWEFKGFAVVTTGWPMRYTDGSVCLSGCPPDVYERARTTIRDGWLRGIQMGAPYNEYRYPEVADAVDPYLVSLRPALDGIVTWEDEPGVELVASQLPAP